MEGRRSIQGAGSMAERQHVSPTDLDSIKLTGKVETITTEESRPVHSANQVPQYQQSLESTYEEVVLHMTEALAALPPAVTRDPRPLSQPALPTRPDPAATSRLPPVPPIAAEAQTPSATTRTAKKKKTQLDTITCHLILSGTVFVAISLLCNHPNVQFKANFRYRFSLFIACVSHLSSPVLHWPSRHSMLLRSPFHDSKETRASEKEEGEISRRWTSAREYRSGRSELERIT